MNRHYRKCRVAALCLTILASTVCLKADSLGLTLVGDSCGGAVGYCGYATLSNVNLGWSFTLSQSVTVSELGGWDLAYGDFDVEIGIWNASGALVASHAVTYTDPTADGFNFEALSSAVVLPAGSYVIGEYFPTNPNGAVFAAFATGYTTDAAVTWTGELWDGRVDGSFEEPAGDTFHGGDDAAYFGPDFMVEGSQSASTPEPATLSLVGLGLAELLRRRRAVAR
jgi:MYXO-CTERM domain-containing protein